MNTAYRETNTLQVALFVDFDNIFISLEEQVTEAADIFATSPDRWLAWLEKEVPVDYLDGVAQKRRILIRRCYLNPQKFGKYRPFFVRAAFEVVDCPPLTKQDKTSTDIHMVMDILDALNHPTYFDEFIILSGDADFTPVLLRLRKHARRSVVLLAGYASPAYKASADLLISQEAFIERGLGITEPEEEIEAPVPEEPASETTESLLIEMGQILYLEAAAAPDGIKANELLAIYKEFEAFRQGSHWLGFNSLRRLTEAIVAQRDDLTIVESDPWRVARLIKLIDTGEIYKPAVVEAATALSDQTYLNEKAEIAKLMQTTVKNSEKPVTMGSLAYTIQQKFGPDRVGPDWFGAGSFKNLLAQLDLGDLKIFTKVPGYVYDPARHEHLLLAGEEQPVPIAAKPVDAFTQAHPALAPLAQKVNRLTDTPYLMPEHYAILLREIAREINERGFQLNQTSKTVRDRCVEKGAPVARAHANFALIGISRAGYQYGQNPPEEPIQLGEALVKNIVNLCRTAQFDPTEEEIAQINQWILGGL